VNRLQECVSSIQKTDANNTTYISKVFQSQDQSSVSNWQQDTDKAGLERVTGSIYINRNEIDCLSKVGSVLQVCNDSVAAPVVLSIADKYLMEKHMFQMLPFHLTPPCSE
jgi:hypothetical protein